VEFIREQRPGVRLIVHEKARGSILSRNELAAATVCAVFVSLDDDSHPIETAAIARIQRQEESGLPFPAPCGIISSTMIQAAKLPLHFDAEGLKADLAVIGGEEWIAHFNKQYFEGTGAASPCARCQAQGRPSSRTRLRARMPTRSSSRGARIFAKSSRRSSVR